MPIEFLPKFTIVIFTPFFLFLASCAVSPRTACEREASQKYSTYAVQQEIKQAKGNVATAEGNIKRGYAIHSQTQPEPFVGTCGDPMTGTFYSCVLPGSKIVETPVAINLNEESKRIRFLKSGLRKLESQLSKTERRRSKAIGQCASLPVK